MNRALRKSTLALFTLAVASMIAGCQTIDLLDPDYRGYEVVFAPKQNDSGDWILDVLSKPQGWEAGSGNPEKKNGYVGFEPHTSGSITLRLQQEPLPSKCDTDTDESADWVITGIALSMSGNRNTQKGMNFGDNQSGWLTKAFCPVDDNGIVLSVPKEEGVVSFLVKNFNNNNGRQWAYYQVTATRCSDGETAVTDPGWQNGGNR